jgi:beta-phosphoglucomutase-like phosphatase (HAD superfamily)
MKRCHELDDSRQAKHQKTAQQQQQQQQQQQETVLRSVDQQETMKKETIDIIMGLHNRIAALEQVCAQLRMVHSSSTTCGMEFYRSIS